MTEDKEVTQQDRIEIAQRKMELEVQKNSSQAVTLEELKQELNRETAKDKDW